MMHPRHRRKDSPLSSVSVYFGAGLVLWAVALCVVLALYPDARSPGAAPRAADAG